MFLVESENVRRSKNGETGRSYSSNFGATKQILLLLSLSLWEFIVHVEQFPFSRAAFILPFVHSHCITAKWPATKMQIVLPLPEMLALCVQIFIFANKICFFLSSFVLMRVNLLCENDTMQTRNDFSLWNRTMCIRLNWFLSKLLVLDYCIRILKAQGCEEKVLILLNATQIVKCGCSLCDTPWLRWVSKIRSISIFTLAYCQFQKFAYHIFHHSVYNSTAYA